MNQLIIPSAVGILVAALITTVFRVHSNSTKTVILGGKTSAVIEATITSIFVFSLFVMIWFSIVVKDMKYPTENPLRFTLEVLASAFLPPLFIFIIYYLRRMPITRKTMYEFALLSVKFGLGHILFQFSGIYSTYLR